MFNFFKKKKETKQEEDSKVSEILELFVRFEQSLEVTYRDRNVKLKENAVWSEVQKLDKKQREEFCLIALDKLIDPLDQNHNHAVVRRKVFKTEFNAKSPPCKESLLIVFNFCKKIKEKKSYHLPVNSILFCYQFYKDNYGKDDFFNDSVDAIIRTANDHWTEGNHLKIAKALIKLSHDANDSAIYDRRDKLGVFLSEKWDTYDEGFKKIIAHCWTPSQKSKPSKTWLKKTNELLELSKQTDGHVGFFEEILHCVITSGKAEVKRLNELDRDIMWSNDRGNEYLYETNEVALSYLIWAASSMDNSKLNFLIGDLALSSYNKIRGVGGLSTKNGNACMIGFTLMSPKAGITQLLNIKNKTRNKSIKNTANKQLANKAAELGLSQEALMELSVSEFNLQGDLSSWTIGDYTGVIDISKLKKSTSYWINNKTEKQQKSIPKEVKENHGDALKDFKKTIKEIATSVSVHSKRLENSYLDKVEWTIEDWKEKYMDHPFLSRYTSKLIWLFDEDVTAILSAEDMVSHQNQKIDLSKFTTVKLWHPIYSNVDEISAWRNFIFEHEIQQPFKQAYREIYIVTDAEITTDTYSNRFAAHILYQHQFSALAKLRDWNYSLQGGFDGHNIPYKSLPKFELRAEYWVEGVEDSLRDGNLFEYVASDQVRIYTGRELLKMEDVPKIVFSEIMRDVDLFVGVTSIGNNAEWQDVGERQTYWQSYSFGDLNETAKTRKEVLEKILPKLKIAKKSKIEGKFLIVEGKIRTYKIHLGSGNILMTPNDQYLCIVPDSKGKKSNIFLPFDNDRTLSIILSKALLLFNDDKIKDTTITRQINL